MAAGVTSAIARRKAAPMPVLTTESRLLAARKFTACRRPVDTSDEIVTGQRRTTANTPRVLAVKPLAKRRPLANPPACAINAAMTT